MADEPKKDRKRRGSERHSQVRWIVSIFFITVLISGTFSFLSSEILESASLVGAFLVLLLIILIGIVFDLLGVAVTAADERPFHSMAARKVPGAQESIRLLRNAGKVASICNDVIGDICGVISGTAAAVIAIEAFSNYQTLAQTLLKLLLSALVAGLTVGGKACGKQLALNNSTAIVHMAGKLVYFFKKPFSHKK